MTPDKLAPKVQRLIDPDQPLPADIAFIPTGLGGWLGPLLLLAFVAPFAVGTAITTPEAWLARLQDQPTDPIALWVGPIVFLITAPITIWAIRRFRVVRHRHRLHRAGRWRQGLFLSPEMLMINHGGHTSLIPRDRIIRITTSGEKIQAEGHPSAPHIVYQDKAGGTRSESLPTTEIAVNLQQWLESGHYPD